MVMHLGKAEVGSSILPGGTTSPHSIDGQAGKTLPGLAMRGERIPKMGGQIVARDYLPNRP